jgi:hypothetical protein
MNTRSGLVLKSEENDEVNGTCREADEEEVRKQWRKRNE